MEIRNKKIYRRCGEINLEVRPHNFFSADLIWVAIWNCVSTFRTIEPLHIFAKICGVNSRHSFQLGRTALVACKYAWKIHQSNKKDAKDCNGCFQRPHAKANGLWKFRFETISTLFASSMHSPGQRGWFDSWSSTRPSPCLRALAKHKNAGVLAKYLPFYRRRLNKAGSNDAFDHHRGKIHIATQI